MRRHRRYYRLLSLVPLLPLQVSLAQTAAPAAKSPSIAKYSAEPYVIERSDWVYAFNADGTGYREVTAAIRIQSESALRDFGVVDIGFASSSERVEIKYARVRHADGTVIDTPVRDAIEQPQPVTREAPFYSDLKQSQLPLKNLQVGDTVEWQVRIDRTRAEALNQFWGEWALSDDDSVTLEQSLELRYPAGTAVTVWTNPTSDTKPSESTDGMMKVTRWAGAQLKPTTGPQAEAAKKAKESKTLSADEEKDADEGKLPAVAWSTFSSWQAVGAWYRGLEGSRATPDDEIRQKVKEITEGKTTPEEQARAVYAYVSAQVRYIGVAFGIGRFQPHEAADVLHNQYGDCKDKGTLLSAMLAALGLKPDAVLIGASIRVNQAVPSPAAFNHEITRVQINGKPVWLDSTQEVAPYEMLMPALRDKQALVVPEQGPALLERTPKDLPFAASDQWSAVGSLDKSGASESHIVMDLRGDDEVIMRAVIHQVAPSKYDELMQNAMRGLGYSGTVSHARISRPEDTSAPLHIELDYQRERAGDWDNLRTVPQLEPVILPLPDEKKPPTSSLTLGSPRTERSTAAMKLPAGWSAELPEAKHEKCAYATYDNTYRLEGGTVYSERKLVVLQSKVPVSDWKTWKKFADSIDIAGEPFIQLLRGSASGSSLKTAGPPTPELIIEGGIGKTGSTMTGNVPANVNDDAETAKLSVEALIGKAMESLKNFDVHESEVLLKKAEAKDPHAARLWLAYATRAVVLGMPREAITDARKELANYPNETRAFILMAQQQEAIHDVAGEETTCLEWGKVDPDDPKPLILRSRLLMAEKKYGEAAQDAGKALALLGDQDDVNKEQLRLSLGTGQVKTGKTKEGEATLTALLKNSTDPGMVNNAAYVLADAGLDLPLAEEREKWAVDKLTEETRTWTLDESAMILSGKSRLLEASWDTYGWILYRGGKGEEAASYVQAALYNHPGDDEVRKHIMTMKPQGTVLPLPSAEKMEKIPMGSSKELYAEALYYILVSSSGVERVKPGTQQSVDGAEGLIRKVDFSKFIPAGSDAHLVITAIVNCVNGRCELDFSPI